VPSRTNPGAPTDDKGYGDQVKRGVASAVDTASDLAGKAQTAAAEAGSTIQGAASETVRQVRDAAAKTYDQGAQAADYLSRNTAEQPLLALLFAGAVGYAIAYLIHSR
jgi:ElaB/YqjD/DUF883 family membrane-anchored ribosome-binding protein